MFLMSDRRQRGCYIKIKRVIASKQLRRTALFNSMGMASCLTFSQDAVRQLDGRLRDSVARLNEDVAVSPHTATPANQILQNGSRMDTDEIVHLSDCCCQFNLLGRSEKVTINNHLTVFEDLPVAEFTGEGCVPSTASNAIRLSLDWDAFDKGKTFIDLFASFLADPSCVEVQALLIGDWGGAGQGDGSAPVVEALVSGHDRLKKLRALFLGEITVSESEISWINQSDVSPLFHAFPNLSTLCLRGGEGLSLGRPQHERLRKLVIETGGMPSTVVREVASAKLPQLEHLELWLGDDGYGNDVSTEDIRLLLTEGPCQRLSYLGLRDDCNADETAKLLAGTKPPATLVSLDLSLGTLGDEGAAALATSGWIRQLKKLDVHHHYVSPGIVAQLRSLIPEVNADDVQEPDDWDGQPHRYVAVAE
jgi:hypothetical protein